MTYIRIDPASLEATAGVFRTATEVLSELGPQVSRACDGVLAPPGVAANVGLDLSTAALGLQTVALELLQEAGDLARRAACCCQGEASSLPVPALVGLAFGAGASLAPQQLIQLSGSSAVSPVAASGPGVVEPSFVSSSAASGPGVMAPSFVSGAASGPGVFAPSAIVPAPAANIAPAPMSLYEALGSSSLGGSSMGSAFGMVYDPTRATGHTLASMPRVPLPGSSANSIMTTSVDIAMQGHYAQVRAGTYASQRATGFNQMNSGW